MNRIIRLSTVLMMLSVLAVSSCENPDGKQNETEFLAVTEGDITVDWKGGECVFYYEVVNPTSDKVIPVVKADWITDVMAETYGEISFTVEENPLEEERKAVVHLDYGSLFLEFNVVQGPKTEMGNKDIQIEIDNVTTTSMHVTVRPSDETMTYLVLSSDMESMAGFEDDDVLFEDAMNYYISISDQYDVSLEEVLSEYLLVGEYDDTFSNLESDTEYCVFAFGVTVSGERLTPIARAYAKTEAIQEIDLTFEIDVDAKYTGDGVSTADVKVVPSDPEEHYCYIMLNQTDYDIYGRSMPEAAVNYMESIINMYLWSGYSRKDVYDLLAVNGEHTFRYNLQPKWNYWFAAFAWDQECNITSEIAWQTFQAPGLESDNKIQIVEVINITGSSAEVVTTASNNDPYWIGVETAASVAGWDDDYLMWALVDYYDMASEVVTGNQTKIFNNLDANTDYVAVAFGFDGGSYTTGLSRMNFRTVEGGDPSLCTFVFNITNLKPRSVDVEVIPSDPSVYYYYELFPGDYTVEQVREYYESQCESQIASGAVADASEYWRWTATFKGRDAWTYSITPNTSYRFVAMAVDIEAGEIANMQSSEVFTSPEAVVSDAVCKLDLSSYYDGDELYAYDPYTYLQTAGKAYLVAKTEVSGPAVHWYHMIYAWADVYDTYSDEMIINNIVNGVKDSGTSGWTCTWDKEYVAYAVAEDADGNYGKVFRQRFVLTKDGVSPIDEITGASAPMVYAPSEANQF